MTHANKPHGSIIRIINAQSGQIVHEIKAHNSGAYACAFSSDGDYVVSTSTEDKTARVSSVVNGTLICILEQHTALLLNVAFSVDGNKVFTACENGVCVRACMFVLFGVSSEALKLVICSLGNLDLGSLSVGRKTCVARFVR
jgi:WD40 repeat protein